jgi:hypothetical protein
MSTCFIFETNELTLVNIHTGPTIKLVGTWFSVLNLPLNLNRTLLAVLNRETIFVQKLAKDVKSLISTKFYVST